MNHVILKAEDLGGYLTPSDREYLDSVYRIYREAMNCYSILDKSGSEAEKKRAEGALLRFSKDMGVIMKEVCKAEKRINVYSFEASQDNRAEISRVVAKIRDINTGNEEFSYYIQRAYEMLFKLAFVGKLGSKKSSRIVKTPVTDPVQNYAVHKLTNIDDKIENAVMCVMLRGALLPSMVMSKEIQEYSSGGYVTPFALFKIRRNEDRFENDMEYILDLDRSFADPCSLKGKDLFFADPMNATGGSLVTVVNYLLSKGIKPASVHFFNVIASLQGALKAVRALENCSVYTLWMDPVLNKKAFIMPGLGDAGDRICGVDPEQSRNIIQLIAGYGSTIVGLYRAQLREIENAVLAAGKR